jgi:hypothetical protein
VEANLFDFFFERVEHAVQHQRAPVTENTVFYLSSLLAEQGRSEGDDTTLVELRYRAIGAPPSEAVQLWRRLGDDSLLLAGYFREHLERRRLSPTYCADMGRSAYRVVSHLLDDTAGSIFDELARQYVHCVDVIAEVRDEARERTDTDLVRLYEEWLSTGSPRVAERLRGLGLVPVRTAGTD